MTEPRQITCPKCSTVLRFTPKAEVSELTCPKCQQKLRYKLKPQSSPSPTTNAIRPQAIKNSPATTPATQRPAATRPPPKSSAPAAPSQSTPFPSTSFPTTNFPAANPTAAQGNSIGDGMDWGALPPASPFGSGGSTYTNPSFGFPAPNTGIHSGYATPRAAKRKNRNGVKFLKYTLIGCGSFIGLCVLGIVGLIGLTVVAKAMPESKTTMTIGEYKVDAPGSKIPDRSPEQKAVFSRKTRSEFSLATKVVSPFGEEFQLEGIINSLQVQGMVQGVPSPVSRAGLSGYRLTLRQPGGLVSEQEIFKMDNKSVLMVIYVSGNSVGQFNMSKSKLDDSTIRALDNPEAFFDSLRR